MIVGLIAIALIAANVAAQTGSKALLPVKINEVPQGDVMAVIEGDDVLVATAFLDGFAIPTSRGTVTVIQDEPFISLRSLASALTFKLNPDDLTLSITVDPHLLGHRVLELHSNVPANDRGGDPSMFFDYALNGGWHGTPNLASEIGANRGNDLFYTALFRQNGVLSRGLSYINFDAPVALRRVTVGDAIVGSDPIGGTAILGGVTLSRQFSLQPYLVSAPPVGITGTATTPSTVEVYVNGQLTNRIQVQPGVFTLNDLPVTSGLGNTQLVIRDAFGRETVEQGGYYFSTGLLQKGLSDYTMSVGAVRPDLSSSFKYGDAATLIQYRRGVTNFLTLGGRLEASKGLVSGGPRATLGSRVGDFDVELAASSTGGRAGSAALFGYTFTSVRYSFGLSTMYRSKEYATLSLASQTDRLTRDTNVFVSTFLGHVSLGITGGLNDTRDGARYRRLAAQASATIGRWGSVFLSAGSVEQAHQTSPEILVGLTISLGHNTTANSLFQRSHGRDSVQLDVRKPLTEANGYGYAFQTDSATRSRLATLQYQTSFGRYEVFGDPKQPTDSSYSISGGLVYLGGVLLPSRALQQGFALARVGVPGVDVYASNQEVGRTNRWGDLLVTNLLPHYSNELRINDKDLPLDYKIEDTLVKVVPPSKGGVVARFPIRKIRGFKGKMLFMIIGEPYIPSLGEVSLQRKDATTQTIPLGRNGEFYIDDRNPGTYTATLRTGRVSCDFALTLPDRPDAVTDLGVIQCAP